MLGPFDGYSTIQIGIAGVVVGSWSSDFVVPAGGAKKERPRHVTGGAKLSYMQQPARRAGEIEPTPFRHRMSLAPALMISLNRYSLGFVGCPLIQFLGELVKADSGVLQLLPHRYVSLRRRQLPQASRPSAVQLRGVHAR